MRFDGHCWRAKQELASDLLLWTPRQGQFRVGRPATTYIDQLCVDVGCLPEDLPTLMQDHDGRRDRVMNVRQMMMTIKITPYDPTLVPHDTICQIIKKVVLSRISFGAYTDATEITSLSQLISPFIHLPLSSLLTL